MKKSFFGELYNKAFRSGNSLYAFIAINVLVFLLLSILSVADFFGHTAISAFLLEQLSLPADLSSLLYRPWSLLTYMFTQVALLHFFFNVLWLYWMGLIFLNFLNNRQFVFTYLAGGIAGGVFFLVLSQLLPNLSMQQAVLIGSSGAVYAVVMACATLVPNYTIQLLFFGNVKLKYLAVAYLLLNLIGLNGTNLGGNLAHLGGALLGFLYIRQLRAGRDWSTLWRSKKKSLRVIRNDRPPRSKQTFSNQEYIDSILDKISQSGYNSLSKEEKEALFRASKQDQNQ